MPKSFGTLNEILGDTNEKPSLKHHSQQFRAPENLGSLLDSMKYPRHLGGVLNNGPIFRGDFFGLVLGRINLGVELGTRTREPKKHIPSVGEVRTIID